MDGIRKKYVSKTSVFAIITENTTITSVKAHSIYLQNNGNTVVRLNGFAPIAAGGFMNIINYNDINVFHDEEFIIVFDKTGVTAPINNLTIYIQKIKGYDYGY